MNIYLIVGMTDEGYSSHYIIQGKNILDATIKELPKNSSYIMGWDFEDYLLNNKIEFKVDEQGKIIIQNSIIKKFCETILEYIFDSRVEGDSNPGYVIFDITNPLHSKVITEVD